MEKKELLYEGKAKKVYTTENPDVLIVDYKDDATAFNGVKKGTIVGKGVVNNRMTNHIFKMLEEKGIPTHFIEELSDRETAVKKVEIVPLEVIVRNVAAGSFSKKLGIEEGFRLLSPTLEFSYTVTEETAVQYRVVRQVGSGWDWQGATTFLDEGDNGDGLLVPGRKTRELTLDGMLEGESGYLMLQVFAVTGEEVILCSERLLAVRPAFVEPTVTLSSADPTLNTASLRELALEAHINVPAEISVSIYDAEGRPVRRLASAQLTRPTPGDITMLYWDGRDNAGNPVPSGAYTAALETVISGNRQKATVDLTVQ